MQAKTAGMIVALDKGHVTFAVMDIAAERAWSNGAIGAKAQAMDAMARLEVLLRMYVSHHQV